MSYIDGFLISVTTANKEAYRAMATKSASLLKEFGATRIAENWGVDVPDGKVTDFKRAVEVEGQDQVVFSWIEWPSKAVRNAANEKYKNDPRTKALGDILFDRNRAVFDGFETVQDIQLITKSFSVLFNWKGKLHDRYLHFRHLFYA